MKGSLDLPYTAIQSLLATVKCYYEIAELLPEGDMGRYKIIEALTAVEKKVLFKTSEALTNRSWVTGIEENLKKKLSDLTGSTHGQMLMVGQSHIDMAWLWPIKEAIQPAVVFRTSAHQGSLPSSHSFIKTESKQVILDTVKHSEDGTGLTLRMYESSGGREKIRLSLAGQVHSAHETNLLEERQAGIYVHGNKLSSLLNPFEVKTILVTFYYNLDKDGEGMHLN